MIRWKGGAWIVYRPVGGIGDAIMIMPAITALRKQIGDELLVVMCIDYIKSVFEHNDAIDYIMPYTELDIAKQKDIVDVAELTKMGCIVYRLHHPCPAAVYENDNCPHIYKSRQEIFAEACDVKFDINNYNFALHEDELNVPEELMLPERYVVVQLRCHDRWRNYWHMKWFLHEIAKVGRKKDFGVVTIDAEMDYGIKDVVALHHIPLNFLFGVIKKSRLVIGPDSSFGHVGGALEVPVLGLYGPTNPHVRLKYKRAYWMPKFRRCKRQYCWYKPCKFRLCMNFKPKAVINRALQILEEDIAS